MKKTDEVLGYHPGSPIHLTAFATLQANTAGSGVNAVALKNPSNLPMEIYEIRFLIRTTNTILTEANTGNLTGHSVACKLSLGNVPLTAGFIPLLMFGKCDYGSREAPNFKFWSHTMRLSKPLFVPAGSAIVPSFAHKGYTTSDIVVRISYAGRNMSASYRPKKVFIPYVSCFSSKPFDTFSTTADLDNSTETDLLNPFDMPLHVERFIGRMGVFDNTPPDDSNPATPPGAISDVAFGFDAIARYTTLRMTDSNGNQIIRDYTSFANAFNYLTRAWETDFELPPKGFYTVFLKKAASGQTLTRYLNQVFVSMVGYRELSGGAS